MHTEATTPRTAYEQDGFYVHARSIFPPGLIQGAIEGMDALREGRYDTGAAPAASPWNPGDDPNKLCKIEMPQIANYAIRDLLNHPRLGQLAAELTGAEWVQVWWVQLLYKPSVTGAKAPTVGWHQDFQYWQHTWAEASQLFTAWIALSDVTEDAGPMRFVRGSQRWGLVDGDFFGDFNAQAMQAPTGETWEEGAAVLPPGGVSFHDKLVLHGSGANISGLPRRSFAVHLRTDKSALREPDTRAGLSEFIDQPDYCPIIFRR